MVSLEKPILRASRNRGCGAAANGMNLDYEKFDQARIRTKIMSQWKTHGQQ